MCLCTLSLKTPKGRISVPCGKCPECLQKRRSEWTFRLMQELKTSKSAMFLTLTYNDENLPIYNKNTKQCFRVSEVECRLISDDIKDDKERYSKVLKDDIQKFIKKLRKANSALSKDQIRYYLVNEYGEHTGRAHFHAIIFNINTKLQRDLESIWNMGNIFIGDVTQSSIHYCTKYMLVPEIENKGFALMSRRPFLGNTYLTINQTKYHRYNNPNTVSHDKEFKIGMPRVYNEKIFPKKVKVKFKKLKFDYYIPAKQMISPNNKIKVKNEIIKEIQKEIVRTKDKKLNYETLERIKDSQSYKKLVKQSKSKNV